MTPDVTGAETHCTIITISESPAAARPDLGRHRRRQRPGHPQRRRHLDQRPADHQGRAGRDSGAAGSRPRTSTRAPATSTFDGHRSDDFHPYVFKTTDFGKTWTAVAAGIPDGQPVYVVREDLEEQEPALPGHRVRRLLQPQRAAQSWTSLQPEPAHGRRPRPAHPSPRQRPDRRDARPRHLDPGRHHGPAPGDRRGPRPGRRPLRAEQARHALAPHPARRLRPRRPLLQGREPARRGPAPLLSQGQARRPRRRWRSRDVAGPLKTTFILDDAERGHQPGGLGPALRSAGRDGPEPGRQPQEADRRAPCCGPTSTDDQKADPDATRPSSSKPTGRTSARSPRSSGSVLPHHRARRHVRRRRRHARRQAAAGGRARAPTSSS